MTSTKPLELTDALDLSIRARRGTLRTDEQRALEHALETSAIVRTAHEVGQCFDATNVVRPGDDALIARAAAAALVTTPARRHKLRGRFVLALAASLAVASVAAATGVVAVRHARNLELERQLANANHHDVTRSHDARGAAPERPAATAGTSTKSAATLPLVDSAAPPPPVDSAAPPTADAPVRARTQSTAPAPVPAPSHEPPEKTAAGLFRDASAARRAGDLATATALFSELSSRFPGTNEARVSEVSLGKLLLGAGRAREAEAAFNAYLRGGTGDLTEEALVGRASALSALGRTADERRAWADLVSRYGVSVYRARAEARIEAIDAAAHASDRKP